MNKETTFEVGSLDWLEARCKNVTATEVSSLFGLNRYKSAKALVKDKKEPKKIWSPHIRRGRILEPAVAQACTEDLDWDVKLYGGSKNVSFFQHPEVALSATPDAMQISADGEILALIELKTANEARIEDWDFGPPDYYALQVHAQMMCTGINKAYIACLGAFDPFPLIVYEIVKSDLIQNKIKNSVVKFWEMYYNNLEYSVDKLDKKEIKSCLQSKRIY